MKKAAYLLFYLALAAAIAFLAWRSREALRAIAPGSWALLIPFAALVGVQTLLSGLANRLVFAGFMEGNSLADNIRLSLVNAIGNLLPVSLGLVSKGVYARKSYGLPLAAFGLLTLWQVGAVLCLSSVTCVVLWLAIPVPGIWPLALVLGAAAAAGALDLHPWLPARLKAMLDRGEYRRLRERGLRQYPSQLGVQALIFLASGAKLFLAYRALGAEPGLGEVFFIYTAVNLSRYVSFTPGGFGIPESVGAAISQHFGVPFSISFLAIALDRILELVLFMLLVPFMLRPGESSPHPEGGVAA